MSAAVWTMGSKLQGHSGHGGDYGTLQATSKTKAAGTAGSSQSFAGNGTTTSGGADGPLCLNISW